MTAPQEHPTSDRNFRLSTSVRPERYQTHVSLDLAAKTFTGRATVSLKLDASSDELVLHAIALDVEQAIVRRSGKTLPAISMTPVKISETVILRFAEPVAAGDAELELVWRGKFTEGLRGLYLAGPIAATQFEAADARRMFPCFDEPGFKARWAISLDVPPNVTALSNGRILSDETKEGVRTVRFEETELLSSYLIAVVVGDLTATPEERVGEIPVRTWSLPHKAHLSRFGQDAALAALPRLQDYFGLPYAFGKVDQVGIPDFEAGAMENAGLITYREVALLLDPATAPLSVQKRVAEVVTHELAHQWFGNWVTMKWWDDLWLNEAFATWMAYKVVDQWRPEWRVWLDFDAGKAAALHMDALRSTHPIRGVVRNASEAGESFDVITYEKGGAVLRMIEGYLGAKGFREGIRLYMRRHARGNAEADELWGALTEASGEPVLEMANAWIRQSGYPLLSLEASGKTVRLSQSRFFSEPGVTSGETWPLPVVLRYSSGGRTHEKRILMREKTLELTLEGEPAWLCGNAENTGFYRVAYDEKTLARLAANVEALSPAERIALLSDSWALVRSDRQSIESFLELTTRFGAEEDDAVLDELVGRLAFIEQVLTEGETREKFRRHVERLLGGQLQTVGWEAGMNDTHGQRLRRSALVRAVGVVARSPSALTEARNRIAPVLENKPGAIEPNLVDSALHIVARAGDQKLFDTLVSKFPTEPDPASQRRYLMALTAFEDAGLAERARSLFFSGAVPQQDTSSFVSGLLANLANREAAWAELRTRWGDVLKRTGGAPMLLRRVVESLGSLRTRKQLEEVRELLSTQPLTEVQQAVAQTRERLEQDVALRERVLPTVASWVDRQA